MHPVLPSPHVLWTLHTLVQHPKSNAKLGTCQRMRVCNSKLHCMRSYQNDLLLTWGNQSWSLVVIKSNWKKSKGHNTFGELWPHERSIHAHINFVGCMWLHWMKWTSNLWMLWNFNGGEFQCMKLPKLIQMNFSVDER